MKKVISDSFAVVYPSYLLFAGGLLGRCGDLLFQLADLLKQLHVLCLLLVKLAFQVTDLLLMRTRQVIKFINRYLAI